MATKVIPEVCPKDQPLSWTLALDGVALSAEALHKA